VAGMAAPNGSLSLEHNDSTHRAAGFSTWI
jgi:hypothetical protein